MGIIFDTCIWVGLASGQLAHQAIINAAGDHPVMLSAVSLGELHFGVEVCADPVERAKRATFLKQVENRSPLDVTERTAPIFGVIAAALKRTGRSPRPRYNDLWIAAQAIEHGYPLLTLNEKDFATIPGLRLITLA